MRDGISWSSDLNSLARRFGERVAVADGGVCSLSYRQLSSRAHGLARRLRQEGAGAGEPVATLVANGPDAAWVSFGVTLAGAAETPLNVALTDAEIRYCADLAGFRRVVAPEALVPRLRALNLDPLPLEAVAPAEDGATLPPVPADAWGRLGFTSGTTGRPKAVVHSHGGRWLAHLLLRAALPFVPAPGDRILLMTPFPHGASLLTYAWLDYGGEIVLLDGVRADRIRPLLEAGKLRAIFAPPTVLAKLLSLFPGSRFSGVECIFCGTQALTPELHARAEAAFGPVVRVTYGMTECFNPITVLESRDVAAAMADPQTATAACVGWPAPGVELEVREEEGHVLPAGESGEIWLRARQAYSGIIGPDGFVPRPEGAWHRTGDLGHFDARGRLWLAGRSADVIKTGGYRVHPAEVEVALEGVGGVDAVCVLGVPSAYWGQIIVVVAEAAPSGWVGQAEAACDGLARYKRPRAFLSADALPRNAQGKLVRREVLAWIDRHYALQDGPYPRLVARDSAEARG